MYVTSPERTINYKWEEGSESLNSNLAIVAMNDIEHLKKEGWKIKSQIPVTEGMVLAKHLLLSDKTGKILFSVCNLL